ncbi:endonuclease/exonuclease/phosphatase family protein [Burkholderia pseudomallei]|nr:endonuclease/exonuclease/phosphatase family protein [Burkholderia pseudomallei]CAJ3176195.1 endonuclease/exonuclease/phosphatase family protein [Burkholderia pseudomallei]CAJ6198502.1 endonuclease/exonuclease/phosphatase family protein [Burkholderia pseudomallei]CAJ6445367.1 endonuclease/exonuclease/phosphatase family protein [Burkholderia pseudomallei]CAJ7177303.1 endonuclease/exonuclease/phosphatase family protein [Burkholderia pseudomallei]
MMPPDTPTPAGAPPNAPTAGDALRDVAPQTGARALGAAAARAQPRTRELRIATYNIHGGLGAWTASAAERIAVVLDELRADVIALQEVPLGGVRGADVLAHLRACTGMHAAEGPTIDTPARRYGNAVLSRFPIRAARSTRTSNAGSACCASSRRISGCRRPSAARRSRGCSPRSTRARCP